MSERCCFWAELVKAPLAVIATEPKRPTDSESRHPSSYLLTLDRIGDQVTRFNQDELKNLPSLHHANWIATPLPDGVEFRHAVGEADLEKIGEKGSLEVVKRFRLPKGPTDAKAGAAEIAPTYVIHFDIECKNTGDQPLEVGYQLDGPTGMTLEGWWYSYKVHPTRFVAAGARDVMWRAEGDKHELVTCSQITRHARKLTRTLRIRVRPCSRRLNRNSCGTSAATRSILRPCCNPRKALIRAP